MSELQAALLVIGFGVIVAVYIFGWWQQKRYRSKFDKAFKGSGADALYKENGASIDYIQQSSVLEGADNAID